MHIERFKQGWPAWVELMTSDDAAAMEFYRELFGWRDVATEIPGGVYHTAHLDDDAIAGLGVQNPDEVARGIPPHWSVYLAVDDVEATASLVAGAGGQVMLPPMDVMGLGRMAIIADPTGGIVGLWQGQMMPGFARHSEPGSVTWCELMTDDAPRAAAFFVSTLGVQSSETDMGGGHAYIMFGPDGEHMAGIMTKTPEMGPMPNVWGVYFEVADTDATVARAQGLGATVLQPPTDITPGRFAMIADPQGAIFGIIASNPM
ncbi:MAG: VOC family protein [Dehalococcoidia bacterium]